MSPDDLKQICKTIISSLDGNQSMADEIIMWRERFLKENMTGDYSSSIKEKEYYSRIWGGFLYTPSETIMKSSPETFLKDCLDSIKSS